MIDFSKLIDPNFKPYTPQDWEHYNEVKGNGAFGWAKDAFDAGALGFLSNVADASQEYLGVGGDLAKTLGNLADINGKTENLNVNSSGYFSNNQGALYDVFNALGSSAPMMAMTAGAGVGASIAGKAITPMLGAGTVANLAKVASLVPEASVLGKSLPLGKLALGNIASSIPESIGEAGGAIAQAREAGMSPDAVRQAGNDTFSENLKLLGASNTAESLLGLGLFSKFGKLADGATKLAKAGNVGLRAGAGALAGGFQNAYEEGVQSEIPLVALGKSQANSFDPSQWSKESQQASDVGFVVGGIMGGVGGTMGSLAGKNANTLTPVNSAVEANAQIDNEINANAVPQAVDAMVNAFMSDPNFDFSLKNISNESMKAMVAKDPVLKNIDPNEALKLVAENFEPKLRALVDAEKQAGQPTSDVNKYDFDPQESKLLVGLVNAFSTSGRKTHSAEEMTRALAGTGLFKDPARMNMAINALRDQNLINEDVIGSDTKFSQMNPNLEKVRETLYGRKSDFPTNLSFKESSVINTALDTLSQSGKPYLSSDEVVSLIRDNLGSNLNSIKNVYGSLNKMGVIEPSGVSKTTSTTSEKIASVENFDKYKSPISTSPEITRDMILSNPDTVFPYGDVKSGAVSEEQPVQFKGTKNSIPFYTKLSPTAFMSDNTYSQNVNDIENSIRKVHGAIVRGKKVVIPSAGIGEKASELKTRAPKTYAYLQERLSSRKKYHTPTLKNLPTGIHVESDNKVLNSIAKEQGVSTYHHFLEGSNLNTGDFNIEHKSSDFHNDNVLSAYNTASYVLGEPVIGKKSSEKNLQRREYIASSYVRVDSSDVVLAVAKIHSGEGVDNSDIVKGNVGYAVEFAKNMGKPIFVFDNSQLYQYDYDTDSFRPRDIMPNLTKSTVAGFYDSKFGASYANNMIRKIFVAYVTSPIDDYTSLSNFNTNVVIPSFADLDINSFTVEVKPLNDSVEFKEGASTFEKLVANQLSKSQILSDTFAKSGLFGSVVDGVNSKGVSEQVHSEKSNNPSSSVHFNTYDSLTSNSKVEKNNGKYFKDIPLDIRYTHRLSQLLGFKDNQLVFFDKLQLLNKQTGKFEASGISGFRSRGISYVSSENAHSPSWLFGHELGHKLQESRMGAKVFTSFKNSFVEALGDKVDKLLVDYASFNGFNVVYDKGVMKFKTPSSLLSRNQLLDEIVCDMIADRVADGNFLDLISREFENKKGFFATAFSSVKDLMNSLRSKALNKPESGLDYGLFNFLGVSLQPDIDRVLASRVHDVIRAELESGGLFIDSPEHEFKSGSSLPSAKDNDYRLSASQKINFSTLGMSFKDKNGSNVVLRDEHKNPYPLITRDKVLKTKTIKVLDKSKPKDEFGNYPLKEVTVTKMFPVGKADFREKRAVDSWIQYCFAIDMLNSLNNNLDLYDAGVRFVDKKSYAGQQNFFDDSDNELLQIGFDNKTNQKVVYWNGLKFTSSNPSVMETVDSYTGNGVVKTNDITKTFDYQHWKSIKDFEDSDFYKFSYVPYEEQIKSAYDKLAKTQQGLNKLNGLKIAHNKNLRLLSLVNSRLNSFNAYNHSSSADLITFKKGLLSKISNFNSSYKTNLEKLNNAYAEHSAEVDRLYEWLKTHDKAYDSRMALIHKYLKMTDGIGMVLGRNFKDPNSIATDAYVTLCQLVGLKHFNPRVGRALERVRDDSAEAGKDTTTALSDDFYKQRVKAFKALEMSKPKDPSKKPILKLYVFPHVLESSIHNVISESFREYDQDKSLMSKGEMKNFDDAIQAEKIREEMGEPDADSSPLAVGKKMGLEAYDSWLADQVNDGLNTSEDFNDIKFAKKKELLGIYIDKANKYMTAKNLSTVSLNSTGDSTSDEAPTMEKVDANETTQSDGEEKILGNNASYEDEHYEGYEKNAPNMARFGLSGILKHGDISSYGSMYVFHHDAIDKLGWSYSGKDNFKKIKESLDSLFSDLENKHYYFNDLASFKLLPKNIQQDIAVKAGFDSAEDLIDGYKSTLKEFSKNPKVVAKTLEHQKITGKNYGVSDNDILDSAHSEMATKVEDYSKNDMNNPDSFPYSRSPKYYNEKFLKMILSKVAGIKEQIKNNPNSKAWFGIVDKLLRSPSKLAQMFPQFKPFYDLAVKSKLQEDSFKKQYMDKFNEAWNSLSSEEKKSLEAIFLMGDKLKRELSPEEMVELGASENVTKAYSSIRGLLNHIRDKINQVNKLTGREEIGYIEAYFPHHWDMYKVVNHSTGETSCYKSYSEASKVAKDMIAKGINASIQIDEGGFQGNFTESGNVVSHVISASELGGIPDNFLEDESLTLVEKHRFLKQLMERKGMGGYSTNVEHVIRKYVNTSARYLALEPFKYSSRILFDNTVGEGKFNAYDLDWSKDPIASYIKDYINGVCGYPTNIEKFFDHIIGQVPFIRDFIVKNTSYGTRYSVGLANMTTEAVAVTTLGFWNPATGILQLSQLANVSTLCGNKLTKDAIERLASNKLTDDDKLALRRSKVEFDSNLANEGYSKGTKSSYNDKIQKLTQKSMWMFEKGDMFVRKVAIMAGYQQGLANGLTPADAIKFAVEVNRKANFDNSVIDSSGLFRNLSVLGSVGLQFKKYGLKQLEFCYDTLISGKDMGEKKRFLATMMLMGGIMGIPFLDLFDEILKGLFGKTIDEDLRQYAIENMGTGAQKELVEFMLYGGGSLVGIDLSRRAGQANLLGGSTENFFPAIGRTMNLIKHVRENGVTSQAIADIVPSAGNVVTGLVEGHPRGIKKVEYTPYEGLIRATGFIPIREAIERDKQKYSMANNNKDKDKKKDKKKD